MKTRQGLGPSVHGRRLAMRLVGAALVALLLMPVGAGASAGRANYQATLLLDWQPNSDHAGIYAALAAGAYARRGLDLKPVVPSDAGTALDAVARGQAQFAISYNTETLLARARGLPLVSIAAIVQHPLNTIITLRASGITRPRQLEGKTVAIYGLASDYADLNTVVKADGGDPKKLRIVTASYDLVSGLRTGKADAIIGVYWSWEGLLLKSRGVKINELRLNQWGVPDYYELVIVTSQRFAAEHPALVRAFLAATAQGYRAAMARPAAAADALIRLNPQYGLAKQRALIVGSVRALGPIMRDPQGRFGWQSATRWQAYANWLVVHKVLTRSVKAGDVMTNAYLP